MHQIPLNESLLLCEFAVRTPIAPSARVHPLPFLFVLPPHFITIHTPAFKWKYHPHTLQ